jgi:hypothetical protein
VPVSDSDATVKETLAGRLKTFAAGATAMYAFNKCFDYLLYPYVIYRAGVLFGGLIMTGLSAIACLAILKFYDWTRKDWLGIETVRNLRHYRSERAAGRLFTWLLARSNAVAFVVLSLNYDPFVTTVWLRHERFGGLSARDRRIFWGSVLLCNASWTLTCWLGVNAAVWAWRWLEGTSGAAPWGQ